MKYLIEKEEDAYYIKINKIKQQIIQINNSINLNEYIKKILNKNGDLFYGYVFSCPKNKYNDLIIKLKNNDILNVKCKPIKNSKYKKQWEFFNTELENNIFYIKNQELNGSEFKSGKGLKENLKPLEQIRDAKFGVLDVRINFGGSDEVVIEMLKKLGFINNSYPLNYLDICARFDEDLSKEELIKKYLKKYNESV